MVTHNGQWLVIDGHLRLAGAGQMDSVTPCSGQHGPITTLTTWVTGL